jgi:enoyl-CoA hydratase
MRTLVRYELEHSVATIRMDDGKVNVLSSDMLSQLNAALDQAQAAKAVVLLTGRAGVFSAGFDLSVLQQGGSEARAMLQSGFQLAVRLLSFPTPVVAACTGHALAMSAFLLLSADLRIGAEGPFKIATHEVAIGMVMPHFGVEMCRQRLTPAHFQRAVITAEIYDPLRAVAAGFLDQAVTADALAATALSAAAGFTKLDQAIHATTKLRVRAHALQAIRQAIVADGLSPD